MRQPELLNSINKIAIKRFLSKLYKLLSSPGNNLSTAIENMGERSRYPHISISSFEIRSRITFSFRNLLERNNHIILTSWSIIPICLHICQLITIPLFVDITIQVKQLNLLIQPNNQPKKKNQQNILHYAEFYTTAFKLMPLCNNFQWRTQYNYHNNIIIWSQDPVSMMPKSHKGSLRWCTDTSCCFKESFSFV